MKVYIFRRHYLVLCSSVLAIILQACGASSSIIINDEYKGRQFDKVSLSVSLPRNEVFIENGDDVTDDLGEGDVYDVFLGFFKEHFTRALRRYSTFNTVKYLELRHGIYYDTNFIKQSYQISRHEMLSFNKPKQGKSIYFEKDSSEFILFIEGFKVHRISASPGVFMPGPIGSPGTHTGGSNAKLGYEFRFIVWDNPKGQSVYYGKVESQDDVGLFSMTIEDWKTNIDALAKEIVKKSPFKKIE